MKKCDVFRKKKMYAVHGHRKHRYCLFIFPIYFFARALLYKKNT